MITYQESQLAAMLNVFEAAEEAINDGHPEFVFAYFAVCRMIAGCEPKKALQEERKTAKEQGYNPAVVDNTMALIAKFQPTVGRLIR